MDVGGEGLRLDALIVAAFFMFGGVVMHVISASYARDKDKINAVGAFITGIVAFILSVAFLAADGAKEPIRHEVTLRPGHVIDATK